MLDTSLLGRKDHFLLVGTATNIQQNHDPSGDGSPAQDTTVIDTFTAASTQTASLLGRILFWWRKSLYFHACID